MKKNLSVTFISNWLSPHQVPLSEAFLKLIGRRYTFISTMPASREREALGWPSCHPSYEIRTYESIKMLEKAKNLAFGSDVVIIGSASDEYIKRRLKRGALTFKYSERLYKNGLSWRHLPRAAISAYIHHGRYQKYPLYILCAGAYVSADLNVFGNYKNKKFKWGYFPETKEYNIDQLMNIKQGEVIEILWAGRFLGWKHPEQALTIAERLNKENIVFSLKMIGDGEEFSRIKNMAENMGLKDCVEFLGTMTPDEVRKHMEKANIYLFTSDFQEGWGAVLNESMNSGCAVVASNAIGSVPFLLKHGENGLIYKNCDVDDLFRQVKRLVDDKQLSIKLGINAYKTIKEIWNAEVAAERFLKTAERLFVGELSYYDNGPMSKGDLDSMGENGC